MSKLTPAQVTALRLAYESPEGIRYYKGGWYSVPSRFGSVRRDFVFDRETHGAAPFTNVATLRSLVSRGLLIHVKPDDSIYNERWALSTAGHEVVAAL